MYGFGQRHFFVGSTLSVGIAASARGPASTGCHYVQRQHDDIGTSARIVVRSAWACRDALKFLGAPANGTSNRIARNGTRNPAPPQTPGNPGRRRQGGRDVAAHCAAAIHHSACLLAANNLSASLACAPVTAQSWLLLLGSRSSRGAQAGSRRIAQQGTRRAAARQVVPVHLSSRAVGAPACPHARRLPVKVSPCV